ncbi:MAG: serine hydrolase domain-containing protein [Ilumatobacteraceae bacterium]
MQEQLNQIAVEEGLSGVVRVEVDGAVVFEGAYGLANRGLGIPNAMDTQFGTASGAKGFTALATMSLVERGELSLDTTARSLLGDDLPLIDDRVTVEHLLSHQSGIGDYLDEEVFDERNGYVMPIPVHQLATPEEYLRVLGGYPMKHEPGAQFVYNNGAFVVLAVLIERAAKTPYHDLVDQRVCAPAGLRDTSFLRSDELPGRAAIGYLETDGLRNNVLHLPVRGVGDGGIYTTAADMHTLWDAFFDCRIVGAETVEAMVYPRSEAPEMEMRYGLGLWLDATTDVVSIHGFDTGANFMSLRDPSGRFAHTVISNITGGAWRVSQRIDALINDSA